MLPRVSDMSVMTECSQSPQGSSPRSSDLVASAGLEVVIDSRSPSESISDSKPCHNDASESNVSSSASAQPVLSGPVCTEALQVIAVQMQPPLGLPSLPLDFSAVSNNSKLESPLANEVDFQMLNPLLMPELAETLGRTSSDGFAYPCAMCDKKFKSKQTLIRHVRLSHIGEKPFQCNICHRRFGYKHILMEHQNLHFGNRPYECNLCNKRFAARSNLIQHQNHHKKPYSCHLCHKRFDKQEQLTRHVSAHPQVLMRCSFCNHMTDSQAEMSQHLLQHPPQVFDALGASSPLDSEGTPASSTAGNTSSGGSGKNSIQLLKCNICSYAARNLPELNKHLFDLHAGLLRKDLPSNDSSSRHIGPQDLREDDDLQNNSNLEQHPSSRLVGAGALLDASGGLSLTGSSLGSSEAEQGQPAESTDDANPTVPSSASAVQSVTSHSTDTAAGTPAQQLTLFTGITTSSNANAEGNIGTGSVALHQPPSYSTQQLARLSAVPLVSALSAPDSPSQLPPFNALFASPTKLGSQASAGSLLNGNLALQEHAQSSLLQLQLQMHQGKAAVGGLMQTAAGAHTLPADVTIIGGMPTIQPALLSLPNVAAGSLPTSAALVTPPMPALTLSSCTSSSAATLSAPATTQPVPVSVINDTSAGHLPPLDETLSHYIQAGKLFRCQHCDILFMERGLYFLHNSLHGTEGPWHCSI